MISNPNLVFYACIAKGSIILAEFTKEPNLDALALKCLEKTPPFHSLFSHTIRKRTYTFMIDGPLVCFGIFDEDLTKSEIHRLLNRLKCQIEALIQSQSITVFENFTSHCLQARFYPVFREIFALDLGLTNLTSSGSVSGQSLSLDSVEGKKAVLTPLLTNKSNGLKKKKKRSSAAETNGEGGKIVTIENKVDVCDDVNGAKDYSLPMEKNVSQAAERQKAEQIWRKHVWVVLLLDLSVCVILFAIWLWVCRGFQCIKS